MTLLQGIQDGTLPADLDGIAPDQASGSSRAPPGTASLDRLVLNQLVTVLQATSALIAGRGGGRPQTVGCALCPHLHAPCMLPACAQIYIQLIWPQASRDAVIHTSLWSLAFVRRAWQVVKGRITCGRIWGCVCQKMPEFAEMLTWRSVAMTWQEQQQQARPHSSSSQRRRRSPASPASAAIQWHSRRGRLQTTPSQTSAQPPVGGASLLI